MPGRNQQNPLAHQATAKFGRAEMLTLPTTAVPIVSAEAGLVPLFDCGVFIIQKFGAKYENFEDSPVNTMYFAYGVLSGGVPLPASSLYIEDNNFILNANGAAYTMEVFSTPQLYLTQAAYAGFRQLSAITLSTSLSTYLGTSLVFGTNNGNNGNLTGGDARDSFIVSCIYYLFNPSTGFFE